MQSLDVQLNGDNCWPDLAEKGFVEGRLAGIARLRRGTESGKSTVTVRIEMGDGSVILAQTTLALLANAVQLFLAVEGDHA